MGNREISNRKHRVKGRIVTLPRLLRLRFHAQRKRVGSNNVPRRCAKKITAKKSKNIKRKVKNTPKVTEYLCAHSTSRTTHKTG